MPVSDAVPAGDAVPVSVRGLSHAFGTGEARSRVLFGIDLDVARGELVMLRGCSGSGKTTLLTLVACLRAVQDGRVRVLGRELNGAPERALVALRRRVGFIFQAHHLHASLSARQNVRMGLGGVSRAVPAESARAIDHLLGALGLGERLNYLPADLSGGQRQRVAIARALVGNPEIVFADEPTAALDEAAARQLVLMLRALGRERGTTTLMVTHDPSLWTTADRVLTMDGGRVVGDVAATSTLAAAPGTAG